LVRTPLCDLVGIEVPVVLAPMGGAVTPTLAAAVSNAGGLGMLPLSWTSPEEIGMVVGETRQRTKRPFGVNLGLAWDQRERLAATLAAGVRIVSFFWGDAGDVIPEARDAGAVVFVTVGTAEKGRAAAAAGADVVVAQGWEAGGHVWGTKFRRSHSSRASSMRSRRSRWSRREGSRTDEV
jgi:nitronate monooxygenase